MTRMRSETTATKTGNSPTMKVIDTPGPRSVLIIDDHNLVRAGIALLVKSIDSIDLVLESASVGAAIDQYGKKYSNEFGELSRLSVILLDVQLEKENGIEKIPSIRKCFENTPIVILSAADDSYSISQAFAAGVEGYLHKTTLSEELETAVQLVAAGGKYYGPSLQDRLAKNHSLTERQQQVLKNMAIGMSNKAIADELGISQNTIHVHVAAILRALDVKNRSSAISAAIRLGLISPT